MADWLDQSEFMSDDGELSPSEHFDSIHTPSLSYTHIRKSLASLEAGLGEFDEKKMKQRFMPMLLFLGGDAVY